MLAEVRAGLEASLQKKKSRSPDLINLGLSGWVRGNVRGATGDTSIKTSDYTVWTPPHLAHVSPVVENSADSGLR